MENTKLVLSHKPPAPFALDSADLTSPPEIPMQYLNLAQTMKMTTNNTESWSTHIDTCLRSVHARPYRPSLLHQLGLV
jgi:hypothetical protein